MSLVSSKTSITDLPDEVLVLIFYYLDGVDKIQMNKTCRRFSEILKERKLSSKLDISSSYYYTLSDLKSYVTPRAFGKNLRVLNITSCYWLNSLDILSMVRRMENLEALYAADTQLRIDHVIILVGCLRQLRRISCTWIMKKLSANALDQRCSHIASSLASIEFLYFYINTEYLLRGDVQAIVIWLSRCTNLEELRIIGLHQMTPIGEYIFSGNIQLTHKFPRLHTLVLSVPGRGTPYGQLAELYQIICMAVRQVKNWQCLWVISPTSLFEILPDSLNSASAFLITRGNMNLPRDRLLNLEQLMANSSDLSTDILGSEMPVLKRLSWCLRQMSYMIENLCPMDGDVLAPEWKMSWDTLWNICCQLEEVNIGSCLRDIDNILIQQNLTKLALPKCILRVRRELCTSLVKTRRQDIIIEPIVAKDSPKVIPAAT